MGLAQGDCAADTVKPTVSATTTPATPDGAAAGSSPASRWR
ncbi:hypothetical protein ACFQX6_59430 [Streptosporangium lutulentum]